MIDKLSEKKMGELQKFGKKYGAMDTKKSELIGELFDKAPLIDIKKYIGEN